MANDVFANGREVSCKKADGKSVCAFPDVCMTPPENPATPPGVPVPYPNTGMAKDTTSGSKSVKISGQEVMLKNKSYFKKSIGDEAGCAAKKGVVTSVNRGKVYFTMWSMDVKIEGENAVRHLDLTTHNHASIPGNSPCWPFLDTQAFTNVSDPCHETAKKVKEKCVDRGIINPKRKTVKRRKVETFTRTATGEVTAKEKQEADFCSDNECKDAMKCVLQPYSPNNCCDGGTPHHVVPKSQFKEPGKGAPALKLKTKKARYDADKAPCVCAQGESHSIGKHGEIHGETNTRTRAFLEVPAGTQIPSDTRWPVAFAERIGAEAVEAATGCPKGCTQAQTRASHEKMKIQRSDSIRPTTAGGEAEPGVTIL